MGMNRKHTEMFRNAIKDIFGGYKKKIIETFKPKFGFSYITLICVVLRKALLLIRQNT